MHIVKLKTFLEAGTVLPHKFQIHGAEFELREDWKFYCMGTPIKSINLSKNSRAPVLNSTFINQGKFKIIRMFTYEIIYVSLEIFSMHIVYTKKINIVRAFKRTVSR